MKSRILPIARLSFSLATALAAMLATPAAHAASSGTWTQTTAGTYNWSDTAQWSGGTVADGATFTASFNPAAGGAIVTTLDSARTLGGISRGGSTTNSWTIANAGFALTLDNGASNANITISANAIAVVTVDTDLVLNSNLVLTDNGNSNNQIILGAAAGGHTITGSGNITFNNSTQFGAGKIIINDNINTTGAIFNNSSPNASQGLSIAGIIGSTVTGVTQNGTATLTLTGANTYTAVTTITAGALAVNAGGSINGSSSVSVSGGGTLNISDSAGIVDRIKDTATVTLGGSTTSGSGGNFAFNGNGATGSATETIGGLALDKGAATITLGNTGAGQLQTLAVGTTGFTRANNGTMLVRGDSLQTAATNATRLSINGASGTGLNLVGGGIANNGVSILGTTKTLSIVPYFIGDTTAAGNGSSFLTYDTSGGLRPLAAGEYTTLVAGSTTAATPENVKAFGGTISTASDVTVNSLLFSTATQTLTGSGGKLIVNSGAVAATATTEVIGSGFSRLTLGNGTWNEGIITPTSGNTLSINTPVDVTGSGGLTKAGAGTLVLAASNLYTGQTTVNQGTLQIGSGTTGDLGSNTAGIVLNGGTLSFGRTNAGLTISNAISGIGGVTQSGSGGTTALSGTNSYTGKTTISAGKLQFAKTASLYNSTTGSWTAANIVVGGTLALNVGGTGEFSTANVTTLQTNLGGANGTSTAGFAAGSSIGFDTTNASGGTFTVASILANSTGTGGGAIGVTKLGTNTLVFNLANTYTGATTVNGGTLQLDMTVSGALASTSALTLGGGNFSVKGKTGAFTTAQTLGALSLGTNTANTITLNSNGGTSTTLTLASSTPTRAAGSTLGIDLSIANTFLSSTLGLTAAAQTATQGILGYATVKDATSTGFATNVGGSIVRYTGAEVLTGSAPTAGANVKTNPTGTSATLTPYLTTSAAPTYNSLSIDTSGATGANFLALNGIVTLTQNAVLMTGNNDFTIQGGTQLGAAASEVIVHQMGTGALTIKSLIGSGATALTKDGTGTLTLTGNNTYTGATTVNAGSLSITAGYFSTGTTINVASGATLTSSANNGFSGGGTGQGGAWTIAGTINGSGTVDQIMPASVTLNNGTMGGAAYASYGTFLAFSAPTTITANGSANTISAGNMGNGAGLTFSTPLSTDALTISGYIGATSALSGSVTKSGTGTLTLNGVNTYTGTTTVNGGTLTLGASASLSASSAITVASGATLSMNCYSGLTSTSTWTNSGTINEINSGNYNSQTMPPTVILNNGTLTGGADNRGTSYGTFWIPTLATITATGNANTISAGNIGLAGSLTLNTTSASDALAISSVLGTSGGVGGTVIKSGLGTLTLSGANIYSGGTILNQGTLTIGTGGKPGATTGALAVNNNNTTAAGTNAILNLATAVDTTVGSLSGTISAPTSGTNTATLNNGGGGRNFTVNQTAVGTYAGVIAGAGAFTLGSLSTNTLTLTGANSYSGATSVTAGTLNVTNTLATSGVTVSGGTLNLSGSGTLGAGTVSASGGTLELGTKSISNTLGALTGGGAVNNGTITNNGSNFDVQSGSVGAVLAGTNGLNKSTGGTVTLSGGNSYTGLTTVSAGALNIGSSGSLNSGNDLTLTSGTADFANANQNLGAVSNSNTATDALYFSNGSGTVVLASLSGSGKTRFGSSGTVGGGISGGTITAGTLLTGTISGSGTVVAGSLSSSSVTGGTNTISSTAGITTLNGGDTTIGGVATIGTMTSGTARLNGSISSITTLNGGAVILGATTLTVGSGTTSGAIIGASGALTVTGALTLSGSNSYGGVTSVGAGADLRINGTHTGSGAVSIAATGKLGGSGSVIGGINVSGTLAPGNSIESLGGGALSFVTGSTYAYELQTNLYGTTPNLAGDLAYSSGALSIAGTTTLTLTDLATTTALANDSKLTLISSVNAWNGGLFTYLGNTLANDSTFTLGANTWKFNYNDTTGGSNFTTDQAGANNYVTMTVIPEPNVAALLGVLGGLALLHRRRNA